MPDQSDDELIRAILRGDVFAGEILCNRYYHYVYNLMCKRTGNPQNAEDLAQEVWMKVFAAITHQKYKPQGKFQQWLNQIISNVHIDWIRSESQFVPLAQDEDNGEEITFDDIRDASPLPEEEVLAGERRHLVKQTLEIASQSSDSEIKACLLHARDHYSYEEIQIQLKLKSSQAAKMKAFRGRHKIRALFQRLSIDYFKE